MQQFEEIRKQFLDKLDPLYDKAEAESIFFIVLEDLFHYSRKDYLLRKSITFNSTDQAKLDGVLLRLLTGEPIQQLVGSTWFMGIPLKVSRDVLIPRPETEELVDLILRDQHVHPIQEARIIDIGTGTGCIPIALKKQLPNAHVTALDVSKEALEIAKYNVLENKVNINFMLADILEWDLIFAADTGFDIIVSNPPYITTSEKRFMHPNVLQFEPHLALFVEDKAPLLFYETIASFALKHLRPKGLLYFEINRNYGQEVKSLLTKKGFSQVVLLQDMHGADRMIKAGL